MSLPHPRITLRARTPRSPTQAAVADRHHTHKAATHTPPALAHHRCRPDDSSNSRRPVFSMRSNARTHAPHLAPLGILWSGIEVGATKGPENGAAATPPAPPTHQPPTAVAHAQHARRQQSNLPQASPPFGLWSKPSNGATCGARARNSAAARRSSGSLQAEAKEAREGGRKKGREEGEAAAAHSQWMTLKHVSIRDHGAHAHRFVVYITRSAATTHTHTTHLSMLPQRGTRTMARSGPLD